MLTIDVFALTNTVPVCDLSPCRFDSQCEENPQLIPRTSTSSNKALERWDDKHVRLLIASYMKFMMVGKRDNIQTRSIFPWLVRVVSDRSVRYNGKQP